MNSVLSSSSVFFPLPSYHFLPSLQKQPQCMFSNCICQPQCYVSPPCLSFQSLTHHFSRARASSLGAAAPKGISSVEATVPEGVVSVINCEDVAEKDWSFLDSEQDKLKVDRIISAGEIQETSRVMVSVGSEAFVDRLVESSPCALLLVVHDSLFVLAGIKGKYDKVKCWQGELIYVPDKWGPLDVAFLYFLPAVALNLGQLFGALARCFSPGARVVISHPQGREVLEQQRKQFADVITSELPEKTTLKEVAVEHCFELTHYVDEPGLYLAVLTFVGAS